MGISLSKVRNGLIVAGGAITVSWIAFFNMAYGESLDINASQSQDTSIASTQNSYAELNEGDRIMLSQAELSCKADDYHGFVDAMIQSKAVQSRYSAERIEFSVRDQSYKLVYQDVFPSKDYTYFPLMMVDYYRKPTVPARPGADDEYVVLEINQSQSDQLSVEWTRVRYDGKSEGGDDLGNALNIDGTPYLAGGRVDGQLLFEAVEGCWNLVSDLRYERD